MNNFESIQKISIASKLGLTAAITVVIFSIVVNVAALYYLAQNLSK